MQVERKYIINFIISDSKGKADKSDIYIETSQSQNILFRKLYDNAVLHLMQFHVHKLANGADYEPASNCHTSTAIMEEIVTDRRYF